MKKLHFITVCPSDTYFTWQVHLWLQSLKEIGYSHKATVLIFEPKGRPKNEKWNQIIEYYPEVEILFYGDDEGVVNPLLRIYIPILRPYTMSRYLLEHPEVKNDAVFYCDSDILFTKDFNIDHLLDDDINYLSDTNSYINASYFDSKVRDVIPEKVEQYKKRDILQETAKIVGIDRALCEKNNLHSGGTQYLLKNTDADFWMKVFKDTLNIRLYLQQVNKQFFENESKGFQSWTADMWGVLWNIWQRGGETKVVKEMDFAWATDDIKRLDSTTIFHNAGVTGEFMDGVPYFYKGKYHQGNSPFADEHLQIILNHPESQEKCTWWYTNKLINLKQKYNLT